MLDDNAFGSDALRAVLKRIREVAGDDGPYAYMIRDLVAESLAVPARNCDRFATADDARDAAKKEFANTMLLDDRQLRAVCDWLFSPAEGGAE